MNRQIINKTHRRNGAVRGGRARAAENESKALAFLVDFERAGMTEAEYAIKHGLRADVVRDRIKAGRKVQDRLRKQISRAKNGGN